MTTPTGSTPVRPAPGMNVTSKFNAEWGAGTVLTVQGERAQVLFTQHPARKPVVVPCKSLVITRAGEWESAVTAFQHRERAAAARSTTGTTKKKTYSRMTQTAAVNLFLEKFPGGFGGEAFQAAERATRWQAHLAFEEQLGGDKLPGLLAEGKATDAVARTLEAVEQSKLLSVFDKARLSKALRSDAEYAKGVLSALAELLGQEVPDEPAFTRYLEALEATPTKTAGQRAMTWPIATVLPALARPAQHLFVKPVATQAAAERMSQDLQYQTALNWETYRRALKLAADLQAALAEHGCKDFLDVQAFLSAVK